jgi:hypothetical protein
MLLKSILSIFIKYFTKKKSGLFFILKFYYLLFIKLKEFLKYIDIISIISILIYNKNIIKIDVYSHNFY